MSSQNVEREGFSQPQVDEGSSVEPAGRGQTKSPSQVFRSRVLDEGIESVEGVVEMYNATTDHDERSAMHEWLRQCADWFHSKRTSELNRGVALEFASLAAIEPRSWQDEDLTLRVFNYLFRRARQGDYREYRDTEALAVALEAFHDETFLGRNDLLVNVVHGVLDELDPERNMLSKDTHKMDGLMLSAAHQALLLIAKTAAGRLSPDRPDGLLRTLEARLDAIVQSQAYFPTLFQVNVVKQGLHRLVRDSRHGVRGLARQALALVAGGTYLYRGVRRFAVADFDVESFEKAFKAIREAAKGGRRGEESWYTMLSELKDAALLSQHVPRKHDAFARMLGCLMDCQERLTGLGREFLRYGIVLELRDLAIGGHKREIREQAVAGLAAFVNRCDRRSWQDVSVEVFEAILEAVRVLHAKDVHRSATRPLLEMVCACDRPEFEVVHLLRSKDADPVRF